MTRFWLLAMLLAAPLRADEGDPVLHVRGRMRLDVERLERVDSNGRRGLVVSGRLLDEAVGEPMPGWTVVLRVDRADHGHGEPDTLVYGNAEPCDVDGNFRFEVPLLARTTYQLRLSTLGDAVFAAAQPVERTIDLGRRNVELRIYAPPEQSASAATLPVVVEAVALDAGASGLADATRENDVPVDLDLDGHPIATLVVKEGRASTALALPSTEPGRELVLRARFAGDDARSPAEATVRVRIVEPAQLALTADVQHASAGDVIPLSGTLRFGTRALADLPVFVRRLADDRETDAPPSVVAHTGEDGSFHAVLVAPLVGTRARFEASFPASEAKVHGLTAVTSEIAVVDLAPRLAIGGPTGKPATLALVVGVATALAIGLLRLLSMRRVVVPPRPPTAPKRRFDALRLPRRRDVSGRVIDQDRRTPLAGAIVRIGDVTLVTDDNGAFSVIAADGPITIAVQHEGFMPSTRTSAIPHRGELAAIDIALVPYRAELLRRYAELLAPHLGPTETLGTRTPRELARLVSGADRATVDAIRRLVEDSCFGADEIAPAVLDRIVEMGRVLHH